MKNKINYYIVALFLLFYPLFSYAQSPEGDEPSLEDTLKWISDNLINHKIKDDCRIDSLEGSSNYNYSPSVIKSCEIVIAKVRNHEKKDDLHWKWTTINKFSGNLGNIRLVELYIPNSNSCFSTPWIAMTIKEESPFEEKESVTYYPTNPYVTNQNRVKTSYARNVTLKFNSLDKAKSFQKAFTHAANLCSKQEKPKNSLF